VIISKRQSSFSHRQQIKLSFIIGGASASNITWHASIPEKIPPYPFTSIYSTPAGMVSEIIPVPPNEFIPIVFNVLGSVIDFNL
jgi:hypothetical protein